MESKLEKLTQENIKLIQKLNDNCKTDFSKLIFKKSLDKAKTFTIFKEEISEFSLSKEIIDFHNAIAEYNANNKALFNNMIEKFKSNILEVFPTATVINLNLFLTAIKKQ